MNELQELDFKDFVLNNNQYKRWKIKDTYLHIMPKTGNWWAVKKFMVIYNEILISRNNIDTNTLQRILDNFELFIESIKNQKLRENAEKYFLTFSAKDVIPFEKFNDSSDPSDEARARKFYAMHLLNQGGQSGVNAKIKEMISRKKTFTEIVTTLKKITRNDSKVRTIIGDFFAFFDRNQVINFYRWGFLPDKEDGYEMHMISRLIADSKNQFELASYCDHQKFKLWLYSPSSDDLDSSQIKSQKVKFIESFNNFEKREYFENFSLNPTIMLFKILNELRKINIKEAYINVYEYRFIISKIKNNQIDDCIKLIQNFRKIQPAEEELRKLADMSRQREFRHNKKNLSEGYLKDLQSFLYGFHTSKKRKNDLRDYNKSSFLEITSSKYGERHSLIENKEDIFKKYFKKILQIEEYIEQSNENLFKNLSRYGSNKIINEIHSKSETLDLCNDMRKENLDKYRQHYKMDIEEQAKISYEWHKYFSSVDYGLLKLCADLNSLVYIEELPKKKIFSDIKDIRNQEEEISTRPPSLIRENIKAKYLIIDGKVELDRKDFGRIKDQIWSERKSGNYRNKYFDKELLMACDLCGEIDSKNDKPQCHHIIDHSLDGPDHKLNLIFLCKSCHNIFTHNTNRKSRNSSHEESERSLKIQKLKIKQLISKEIFENLIDEDLITKDHLEWLFHDRYINFVELLDLCKQRKQKDYFLENKSKDAKRRWPRAMDEVWKRRINRHEVMGKINYSFEISKCDAGCGKSISNNKKRVRECHHMIPKSGSTSSDFKKDYGDEPMLGPESEFNYLYLCSECHKEFTHHSPKRKKLISNIVKKGLVTYETVFQMVVSNDLNKRQLGFLLKEGFVNKNCYKRLIDDYKIYSQNSI